MTEPSIRSMCVPAEHPVFLGHFPGNPIVPGVMLLEWVLSEAARDLGRTPAALRVRETKFFSPLGPGQSAELVYEVNGQRCAFEIRCGSTRVARGILEWDADV